MLDVYRNVEIQDTKHAQEILSLIISAVFDDVNTDVLSAGPTPQEDDECDFDEDFIGERNEILQDDDLFDIIVDN